MMLRVLDEKHNFRDVHCIPLKFSSYIELGNHVCQAREQRIHQNDHIEPEMK